LAKEWGTYPPLKLAKEWGAYPPMGTPATICYLSFLDYYELSFLDYYELSFLDYYELSFRRAVSNGDSYLSHPVFDGE
jgi:hypothetical protein